MKYPYQFGYSKPLMPAGRGLFDKITLQRITDLGSPAVHLPDSLAIVVLPTEEFPMTDYASAPEKNPKKYEITVVDKTFPMRRWREAILYFLFGVWSGERTFWRAPWIRFGELTLVLKTSDCRLPEMADHFVAHGVAPDDQSSSFYGNYPLRVGNSRAAIMDALARFAKDPSLGLLEIRIEEGILLVFFQKERRGEYGCLVRAHD